MATITHGADGIRTDVSSRSAPTVKDDAKFHNVVEVSGSIAGAGAIFHATGSKKNSSGFIVSVAGTSVITTTEGGTLNATDLTAKTLYEIGVSKVSGSGRISVVY
tara:strand:- start:20 stop:334 length:315 start_codon:yes stop_codon:yes gene_type:complete